MRRFTKCFDGSRNNMPFLSEDEEITTKCHIIWKTIITKNGFKLDSQPVCDKKYIKTKLKTYDDKVSTTFTDNKTQKKTTHYSCISAICINFVLELNEENHPQVHLE